MMQVLYAVCCGLDVHQQSVTACLLTQGAQGRTVREFRTFSTMTSGLRELAEWLRTAGCRHVALESTGVYWKPVYNVLEGQCEELLLVNAQHVKQVPGRKTDLKDAEWIAQLLQHGLLRGSFVPPVEIRELRELTRYRKTLIQQRANQCNRIQKLLEACNIKLASVASDVLGVSGWQMLQALAAGQTDPAQLAEFARGRLRKKIPQLIQALEGVLSETQRWLLGEELSQVAQLDEAIGRLDAKVGQLSAPFAPAIQTLCQIPGVSRRVAEVIVSEIGVDMSRFPTAANLASWAGLCPGNHQSAGKRQSGKTRPGNRWLRGTLTEAGWAAAHTKHTYLASFYSRVARRRGAKKACLATAHTILRTAHLLLSHPELEYHDLGPDYFEKRGREELKRRLLRQLHNLGVQVTIHDNAA